MMNILSKRHFKIDKELETRGILQMKRVKCETHVFDVNFDKDPL